MAYTAKLTRSITIGGKTYTQQRTLSGGLPLVRSESVPAAKAGTLSARTDNDTGTATLGASHGIVDGDRVDVYWDGGRRYGMTVGTVSGTSVPVDGGAGDNLPVLTTVIQVAVAQEKTLSFTGNSAQAIVANSPAAGLVIFCSGTNTAELVLDLDAGETYLWDESGAVANPLLGDTITKFFVSHKDTSAAKVIAAGALIT